MSIARTEHSQDAGAAKDAGKTHEHVAKEPAGQEQAEDQPGLVQQWFAFHRPAFTEADLVDALEKETQRKPGTVDLTGPERDFWDRHADINADAPTVAQAAAANTAERALMDSTAMTVEQVAKLLGLSNSTVRHYKSSSKLFAYERGGKSLFPVWQFAIVERQAIPHLGVVLKVLPKGIHPQSVQGLFTTPQPDLVLRGKPVSPKEWLEAGGDPGHVAALAQTLGDGH